MDEVRPSDLRDLCWAQDFNWTRASDDGYLERNTDFTRFHIRYSLTQKALDKLKGNQNGS